MGKGRLIRATSGMVALSIVSLYCVLSLFPYLWLILTSLKPEAQTTALPIRVFPSPATLANYSDLLFESGKLLAIRLVPAFLNTVIISSGSILLALLCGLPAAYSFAKYYFKGSRVMFVTILVTRMFPIISLAIPLFQLARLLGLYDTKIGMILSYTSLVLPFLIWMMFAFFRDFPDELEDAAEIDGCSFPVAFLRIVLPLSMPGVVAVVVLSLIYPWNDLLLSTILTSSSRSQTLAAALSQFNTGFQVYWGHLTAASVIASLPLLLITLFLGKYIVQGLMQGTLKG